MKRGDGQRCAECGLPIPECSAMAMARVALEKYLMDFEGYSAADAKEARRRLIPEIKNEG
jgi:hypothetical protein